MHTAIPGAISDSNRWPIRQKTHTVPFASTRHRRTEAFAPEFGGSPKTQDARCSPFLCQEGQYAILAVLTGLQNAPTADNLPGQYIECIEYVLISCVDGLQEVTIFFWLRKRR